jgi:5'/3'-nucleotidase SurE
MRHFRAALALTIGLALAPSSALAGLNILVSNDDGFDQPGIQALAAALSAAGHTVTVVAPATEQSGKGGSINTNVLDFTPGVGLMQLTNHGGGVYSLAGTPVDSVKAALDVVMAGNPPDLIVTGLNSGQNLAKPTSNTSGTMGAALTGVFNGIPSIATSVGILFSEAGDDFPSTLAAYPDAADFVVSLVAEVEANGMPDKVDMLNVNFPVPYEDIQGVAVTKLGDESDLALPLFDPSQGFPSLGIPPLPSFPPCSVSPVCFVGVGVGFPQGPDEEKDADTDAHRADFISITPMDGDMAVGGKGFDATVDLVDGLTP